MRMILDACLEDLCAPDVGHRAASQGAVGAGALVDAARASIAKQAR